MDGTGDHYVHGNKADTERKILLFISYVESRF
jgi:hypothetical protein